jgi:23S rRNA (uridine2552-2'-O)-methyltransferase
MSKQYTPNDIYSQKARELGYRARSVFKLEDLDNRFGLLRGKKRIIDIGACPGSWLQYTANHAKDATIIGIDLEPIEPIDGVFTYVADILDYDSVDPILAQHNCSAVDLILSDLAPKTSGIKDTDQWRSIELSQFVTVFAQRYLTQSGTMVLKILRGGDFDAFFKVLKEHFSAAHIVHANASRDSSREVYVVAIKPKSSFKHAELFTEE